MNPQTNTIQIRRAEVGDLQEVCLLAGQLGYPGSSEQFLARLERILGNPSQEILVVEIAGCRAAGYIHVLLQNFLEIDPIVEVGGLVVNQEYRHIGIGKALLTAAEDWAKNAGCRQIRLHSNIIRTEAHTFYLTLGYSIIKTQHAFLKKLT